ncbi:MAG TPA: single-stranded DNA-binding protein [Exilispira sp.]|jgi:single stranded DNA-binding protein|nr:single-stranded DNA-binding protein [Exilispira sp.]
MAYDFNRVIIAGRLVKDPQYQEVTGSNGVASLLKFTLVNQAYRSVEPSYFDCTFWGKRVEFFKDKLSKGSHIIVEGELRQERWIDKASGEKKSKIVINVSSIYFISSWSSNFSQDSEDHNQTFTDRNSSVFPGKETSEDSSMPTMISEKDLNGESWSQEPFSFGEDGEYSGDDDNKFYTN